MRRLIIPFFVFSTMMISCQESDDNKFDYPNPDYEISVDESFQLNLASPSTDGGYRWVWNNNQSSIIDSINFSYAIDNPDVVGSGGTETWVFKGIKSGIEKIEFEYKRPFEMNSTIQTKEIVVKIK